MTELSGKDLKRAILEVLNSQAQGNKINLLGRSDFQQGALEGHLNREFNVDERARASHAFEKLRMDGYLQATYKDLAEPENWVAITSRGREFLSRDLKDHIDLALERISSVFSILYFAPTNLLNHLAAPSCSRLGSNWDRCGVYYVEPIE